MFIYTSHGSKFDYTQREPENTDCPFYRVPEQNSYHVMS
jgi:hypothetical protein